MTEHEKHLQGQEYYCQCPGCGGGTVRSEDCVILNCGCCSHNIEAHSTLHQLPAGVSLRPYEDDRSHTNPSGKK